MRNVVEDLGKKKVVWFPPYYLRVVWGVCGCKVVLIAEGIFSYGIANFTNTQNSNGWMLLEVQTRERNGFISFYK